MGAVSGPAGHLSSQPATAWVVLAAGLGTRMRSATAKVLQPLCGRPLGAYALKTAAAHPEWQFVMVTGHEADRVEAEMASWACRLGVQVSFARQVPQLGTGHAVQMALPVLAPTVEEVLVSYGDVPLLTPGTLEALQGARRQAGAALSVLTAIPASPSGYGRILRSSQPDGDGDIVGVVEEKDATPQQKAIREVNTGIYCFARSALEEAVRALRRDNAQGEYYLTDTVAWLAGRGQRVVGVAVSDPAEVAGVNDRRQLAELEALVYERTRLRLMAEGVSFVGYPPAMVDPWAHVGPECMLHSGAYVGGESRLGRGCTIGPGARLVDCVLGDGVQVDGVTLFGCRVGDGARVGAGVAIPPGCRIAPGAVIGQVPGVPASFRGGQRP